MIPSSIRSWHCWATRNTCAVATSRWPKLPEMRWRFVVHFQPYHPYEHITWASMDSTCIPVTQPESRKNVRSEVKGKFKPDGASQYGRYTSVNIYGCQGTIYGVHCHHTEPLTATSEFLLSTVETLEERFPLWGIKWKHFKESDSGKPYRFLRLAFSSSSHCSDFSPTSFTYLKHHHSMNQDVSAARCEKPFVTSHHCSARCTCIEVTGNELMSCDLSFMIHSQSQLSLWTQSLSNRGLHWDNIKEKFDSSYARKIWTRWWRLPVRSLRSIPNHIGDYSGNSTLNTIVKEVLASNRCVTSDYSNLVHI